MSQPATSSPDPSPSDFTPIGSPSPDPPSQGSSPSISLSPARSATPSLPLQHSALHAATNDFRGGHRSFLDFIFDSSLHYDDARAFILQGLSTADFEDLRQTCRSIDHCLMMPPLAGPAHLRHLPDLINKCHEFGLPVPPSLPPRGPCPNSPQGTVRIRACQFCRHNPLRFANPHQNVTTHPQEHWVCEVCRPNRHSNIATNPD